MKGFVSLIPFNILRVIPYASAARDPAQRCALPGDTHIPVFRFLCLKSGPPKLKTGFRKISAARILINRSHIPHLLLCI